MTGLDVDAIEARAAAATDGPWTTGEDGLVWPPHMGDPVSGSIWLPDSAFIAAARTDVPALVAEVKRLREQLDKPCGSCHPCTNYADQTWRAAGRKPPHVYQWDLARKALTDIAGMVHQFDTPADAGRVRAFVGDVGRVAARGLDQD